MTRTNNIPNTITLSVSLGDSDQLTSLVHSLVEKELASVLSRLVGGLEPPTNKAAVSEPAPAVSKVSAPVPENVEAAPKPKRVTAPAVPVLDCIGAVPRPYCPVPDNWDDIVRRYQNGEIAQEQAAREAGVSVATLSKYAGPSRYRSGAGSYRKRVRPDNWYEVVDRLYNGDLTVGEAAAEVHMSRSTFYKYRSGSYLFADATP